MEGNIMSIQANLFINTSPEEAWKVITDIEKAQERIKCIKDIKILERPESGVVGLKWEETREMFGKEAIETMWIDQAVENEFYTTKAENCGCVYTSRVEIVKAENGIELKMSFSAEPQTFVAKLMTPMMFFMKGAIKKAFQKDLQDLKIFLEK